MRVSHSMKTQALGRIVRLGRAENWSTFIAMGSASWLRRAAFTSGLGLFIGDLATIEARRFFKRYEGQRHRSPSLTILPNA